MKLTTSQQYEAENFLKENRLNLPNWYRSYKWKGGFFDLFRLEKEISEAARQKSIEKRHLLDIADWGGLRNKKRISCPRYIKIQLYSKDSPARWLKRNPAKAVEDLEKQIIGFGPTYSSKILHFAVPEIFGALDTRLVRAFGQGDPDTQRYSLLNLEVFKQGNGWMIPSHQVDWPAEYGTWTNILNYIAGTLNKEGVACPHPKQYTQSGLRKKGVWFPADVETALFSYATKCVSNYEK